MLATSDETNEREWAAANTALRQALAAAHNKFASFDDNFTATVNTSTSNATAPTTPTTTNGSNIGNATFSSLHNNSSGASFELERRGCALVSFDATATWLHAKLSRQQQSASSRGSHSTQQTVRDLWLVLDVDSGGKTNRSSSSSVIGEDSDDNRTATPPLTFVYDLAYLCSDAPYLAPTPSPSNTPRPSPAPSTVPARRNCVCMTAAMVEGVTQNCPLVADRFREGCMEGLTRADLAEISGYCPILKLDWGPFFDFEDPHNGDGVDGDWQRGKSEFGIKIGGM